MKYNLQLTMIYFFDVLLIEIRGKTISNSSYKKRLNIDKEIKLLEEIQVFENDCNRNYGKRSLTER